MCSSDLGDTVEIFPAYEEQGVRVELWGDEIERISKINALTGETIAVLERAGIYPAKHFITNRPSLERAVNAIRAELVERLQLLRNSGKLLEAQRLESRTNFDIEMMLEIGYCSGIENYSRYLSGRQAGEPPPTLFDYLPENAILFVDESHVTIPQLGGMYRGDRSRKENLVEYGFRLPCALDNRPLRFDEFEQLSPQTIYVSATPGKYEREHSGKVVELVVRPTGLVDPEVEVRPASTQVDDLLSEIGKRIAVNERVLVTTLTKRMAEDLTEYLAGHGIRVRYLHSDIETVERVEIIRDLRLGSFDVLVGINLLREGLDMPEVSLVAILDADKEGFLRSETTLIQTIGRAARNINGMAILYADSITGSMERALGETERRREKQNHYNEAHGITPKGIKKAVTDIMENARSGPRKTLGVREDRPVFDPEDLPILDPELSMKRIERLEEEMYRNARDLEFEEAARLRDKIRGLRNIMMGLPNDRSG